MRAAVRITQSTHLKVHAMKLVKSYDTISQLFCPTSLFFFFFLDPAFGPSWSCVLSVSSSGSSCTCRRVFFMRFQSAPG